MPPSSTSAPGHLRSWRFEEYIVVHHYLSMVISALLRRLHLPEHQSTFAPTASRSTLSWFFLCLNSHNGAASIYWSTCVLQRVHFSVATTTSTLVFSQYFFPCASRSILSASSSCPSLYFYATFIYLNPYRFEEYIVAASSLPNLSHLPGPMRSLPLLPPRSRSLTRLRI